MDFKNFLELYNQLSDIHKIIVMDMVKNLSEPIVVEGKFGEMLKEFIENEKEFTGKTKMNILEKLTAGGTDSDIETLTKAMQRNSKKSVLEETVYGNLEKQGITKGQFAKIALSEKLTEASAKVCSLNELYSKLSDKNKKAVISLAINLWYDEKSPEYFEQNENEYGEIENGE